MPSSRKEINFTRLLSRCEVMAAENSDNDWRLEKYITTLQNMLTELKKSPEKPSFEIMRNYEKKVDFLKNVIDTEKLPSTAEKVHHNQLIAPSRTIKLPDSKVNNPIDSSKYLHRVTSSRYQKDMRKELFGEDDDFSEGGLRQRRGVELQSTTEDLDAVLQHHQNLQEKLAEEMLSLTRNLKHNSIVASSIIQEDNKRLEESNKLAEGNFSKLKVEADRLEKHAQKSCNWWIWGTVFIVSLVFLQMILFIRFVPKRS